jgi:Domain of unknown function (DUF4386)
MDTRRTGRIFGWFFIGTFITSIPARLLFVDGLGATWTDTVFNPGAVSDTSLQLGSILEFGVIVTNIATAVVIYPLVKRQSATVGLGYVTARIMESAFIAIGLISIITVVDVNEAWTAAASDTEAIALEAQGNTLVSTYDWAFPVRARTRCGLRQRPDAGLPDVPLRARAAPHGDPGTHRWPAADHLVRAHPVRGLRERVSSFGADGTPGDRLGGLARHLLRVEGLPAEPDRRAKVAIA